MTLTCTWKVFTLIYFIVKAAILLI